MKFSSLTLLNDKRTEVNINLRENAYNFSALRGWDITLDGAAVVLLHPDRALPLVIPFASVERADGALLTGSESTELKPKAAKPKGGK